MGNNNEITSKISSMRRVINGSGEKKDSTLFREDFLEIKIIVIIMVVLL